MGLCSCCFSSLHTLPHQHQRLIFAPLPAGIATQLFFILGEFVLVILAFIFGTWRSLAIACAVVCASFLVLWPVVPESARWQLVRGDKQAATAGKLRRQG